MPETAQSLKGRLYKILCFGGSISAIFHFGIYAGWLRYSFDSSIIQALLIAFVVINFCSSVGYMIFRQNPKIPYWLYAVLANSIGVMFSLFVFMLFYQFLSLFLRPDKNPEIAYLGDFVLILAFFYIIYGFYKGRAKPTIKEVSIPINKLASELSIIQLSDIHINHFTKTDWIEKIVSLTNEQSPDIIALTGDIVDIHSKEAKEAINELGNLNAKYGVYYVLGNHEYFYDTKNIIEALKNLGIKVLLNENLVISKDNEPLVNIAGITDLMGKNLGFLQPDIKKTFANLNNAIPTILLSHQPKIIQYLRERSIDLILSGHTHGGQIFPFNLAVLLQQPHIKGLHQFKKGCFLYINQGTGIWGPQMRIGSHSEITRIHLLAK